MKPVLRLSNSTRTAESSCEICDVIAELHLPAEAHDTFTCAKQKYREEHSVLSWVASRAHLPNIFQHLLRSKPRSTGFVCAH